MPRLLITEDRPEMLRLIDRALGEHYRCEFAASVSQAHEKLVSTRFALALCDLQMAGDSGLALAEEITEEHPETAVVLITDRDDPEVAQWAFALGGHGVHGYLVKPFWPGQLLITAMNALRRRELEIGERSYWRNLEDQRQAIIDMAPMPIYVKDDSLRYVFVNLPGDQITGLQTGELIGKTDAAILAADELARAEAIDRRILAEGVEYEAELTVAVSGVERTFQTIRFPLLGEDGRATAICGISTDITAQRDALRLRDELAAAQQDAIEEMRLSRQETVERLTRAIELHDDETGEHVKRIGKVAGFLAAGLGLEEQRVQLLQLAAPMHDVGKIATAGEILRKPGPLSAAEREDMQRHTTVGEEIFANSESELLRVAGSIALTHHERFDGSGYPRGLKGEEIPLEGRITAVADVFDALLSDRSYRGAMEVEEAIEIISDGSGSHFDPEIVAILVDGVDEALSLRA